MGINKLAGTPWHIERYERTEGDNRRHRSHCVYYNGKSDGYCKYYFARCHGASHCDYYYEKYEPLEEIKEPVVLKQIDIKKPAEAMPFKGIKMLEISKISVDAIFKKSPPRKSKIDAVLEYYQVHGELDKPIVVDIENGKYKLKDKYIWLLAAKKLKSETVPTEMGNVAEVNERDALRKLGTLVWQQKHAEVGEVINVTLSTVTIKYDDGRIRIYDIHVCLGSGNIRVL